CPKIRNLPLPLAHLPFPSIMMAICRGSFLVSIFSLRDIRWKTCENNQKLLVQGLGGMILNASDMPEKMYQSLSWGLPLVSPGTARYFPPFTSPERSEKVMACSSPMALKSG